MTSNAHALIVIALEMRADYLQKLALDVAITIPAEAAALQFQVFESRAIAEDFRSGAATVSAVPTN